MTKAGHELMLNAQPAWLMAQVQAEALLGEDGMIALINITDRHSGSANIKACVASAERRATVRPPLQQATLQRSNGMRALP